MRNLNSNMKAPKNFNQFNSFQHILWLDALRFEKIIQANSSHLYRRFLHFDRLFLLIAMLCFSCILLLSSSTSTVCKTKRVSNSSEKRWQLLCIFFWIISQVSKDGDREHLLCTTYFSLFKRNIKKYAATLFS